MSAPDTPTHRTLPKITFKFGQGEPSSVATSSTDILRPSPGSSFLGQVFNGADPTPEHSGQPDSNSTPSARMTRNSSRSTRQTSQSAEPVITSRRTTRRSIEGEGVEVLNGNSIEHSATNWSASIGAKPRAAKKGKAKVDDSDEDGDYQSSGGDDDEDVDMDAEGEVDEEDDYNQQPKPTARSRSRKKPDSDDGDDDFVEQDDAPVKKERFIPKRKAAPPKVADSEEEEEEDLKDDKPELVEHRTRSGRTTTRPVEYPSDDSQAEARENKKRTKLRRGSDRHGEGEGEYAEPVQDGSTYEDSDGNLKRRTKHRERRNSGDYVSAGQTTTDTGSEPDLNDDDSGADEMVIAARNAQPRALRQKNKIDYYRPLNIDPVEGSGKKRRKSGQGRGMFGGLPSKMTGEQYAALYPGMQQDSDSVSGKTWSRGHSVATSV